MTIQPLSGHSREVSVTAPVEPAYDRVKLMLFKPFDLTKWIIIGFCAWLAGLGESGTGGSFSYGGGGGQHNVHAQEEFKRAYHEVSDYVVANLAWIVPLAGFLILVAFAIGVFILWVNSRGKFMFLHCVVWNKAEVEEPWREFAGAANSLFWFRLVLGFIGMILTLPILAIVVLSVMRMVNRGEPDVPGILLCVGLGLVFLVLCLLFALIQKFLVDFVVPIMFLRRGSCLAAWREFWQLLCAWPGQFILYILFQIALGVAIGILILMATLATCCILGCFLAIPFVGTVLLLPVLVFQRAYPLYYLAQFGPQYDVFPPAPPITPDIPTTPAGSPPPVFGQ